MKVWLKTAAAETVIVAAKTLLVFFLTASMLTGCADQASELLKCRNNLTRIGRENDRLKANLSASRQKINSQSAQIAKLEEFGNNRLKNLLHVQRIHLDRLTGGYDADNDHRDDGIVVFLQPIDTEGDVFKTAGEVTVKLFSLSDKPILLGEVHLSPGELSKSWAGRFWTSHFTIRCPFRVKPKDPNVTLQVKFTELLTGKTFTAQRVCKLH